MHLCHGNLSSSAGWVTSKHAVVKFVVMYEYFDALVQETNNSSA